MTSCGRDGDGKGNGDGDEEEEYVNTAGGRQCTLAFDRLCILHH